MKIKQNNNWLGYRMASLKESEIDNLFREITDFRRTGILVGGFLRQLDKEFSDNVSHTSYGDCMRLVEDAVLYEMARRYYNRNK